jgi:hypothetical protein
MEKAQEMYVCPHATNQKFKIKFHVDINEIQ